MHSLYVEEMHPRITRTTCIHAKSIAIDEKAMEVMRRDYLPPIIKISS